VALLSAHAPFDWRRRYSAALCGRTRTRPRYPSFARLPSPKWRFGLVVTVVTGGHLEVVLGHLFEPEQLVGAGGENADLGAGSTLVAGQAIEADIEIILRRQIVVIDEERARGEGLVVANDVQLAVAVDVAEAQPVVDRGGRGVGDSPVLFMYVKLPPPVPRSTLR